MWDFLGGTVEESSQRLREEGEKPFRAKQIAEWIYGKGVFSFAEMSNLSKDLREQLTERVGLYTLKQVRMTPSDDGETFKFLWRLPDGALVESVLICSEERRTVCVSSQVGCAARCAFCASGKKGFRRHLTTAEIVEQVLQIHHWLAKKEERVSHVVYMGMGEPLENYKAVVRSIRVLSDPQGLGLSQRRITVSTVGVVEGIEKLREEELKVNLVFSLHAPNQHVRKKIIPYARRYPLEEILAELDTYVALTKRNTTFEYILIQGINDQPEHAEELAKLVGKRPCTVNLIPYNPVEGLRLKRPAATVIRRFQAILQKRNVVVTCRWTKGDDIAAACGQLALQEENSASAA